MNKIGFDLLGCQSDVLNPTYVYDNPIYKADFEVRLEDVIHAAKGAIDAISIGMKQCIYDTEKNPENLKDGEFAIGNWIVRPRFPSVQQFMPRAKTYHDGAREERACWINKIKRQLKEAPTSCFLRILLEWGQARRKRYESEPGGLGRKKKA